MKGACTIRFSWSDNDKHGDGVWELPDDVGTAGAARVGQWWHGRGQGMPTKRTRSRLPGRVRSPAGWRVRLTRRLRCLWRGHEWAMTWTNGVASGGRRVEWRCRRCGAHALTRG